MNLLIVGDHLPVGVDHDRRAIDHALDLLFFGETKDDMGITRNGAAGHGAHGVFIDLLGQFTER